MAEINNQEYICFDWGNFTDLTIEVIKDGRSAESERAAITKMFSSIEGI